MSLRPYQGECLDAMVAAHRDGVHGQLINLPTGTGKTVVASHLPGLTLKPGQKKLFIVQAEELVWQAQEKIQYYNPDAMVGVEKADRYADLDRHDFVIASIQSLAKRARLQRFDRHAFKEIGVDEAHHVKKSGMYYEVLRHFCALRGEPDFDPSILLYGLTATVNRSDGEGLEHTFSKITYHKSLIDLMRTGIWIEGKLYPYIADIICDRVDSYVDISQVRVKGKDLDEKELADVIDTPERNKIVIESYKRLGENMAAFGYPVNVAHAHHLAEEGCNRGVPSVVMSGDTSRAERIRLFAALEEGSLKIIFSAGVLGEGVDKPFASVALMTRPYRSDLLYRQTVGRVVRPNPSPEEVLKRHRARQPLGYIKPYARIIDFADQSGRHQLIEAPSLFGLRNDFVMEKSALETIKEIEKIQEQHVLDLSKHKSVYEIRSVTERVDILAAPTVPARLKGITKFLWVETAPNKFVLHIKNTRSVRVTECAAGWEISTYGNGFKTVRQVLLPGQLRDAIEFADDLVPREERRGLMESTAINNSPPSEQVCAVLFRMDTAIQGTHGTARELWWYAQQQYDRGNMAYSAHGIGLQIMLRKSAEPSWKARYRHQKIVQHAKAKRRNSR